MALTMGLTMAGLSEAAPSRVTNVKSIGKITSSAQFKGRQTPKFNKTTIVIPPIDYSGGANLEAAKASVAKALADVQKEVSDQNTVIKGNKTRIAAAEKNVAKYSAIRVDLSGQYDAIKAEVDTLAAIQNPSSAVQACLAELREDLLAVKKQILNTDQTIKEYKSRVKFYNEVSEQAAGNLKRLNTAVQYLTNAHKTLSLVKNPAPKADWLKPVSFK